MDNVTENTLTCRVFSKWNKIKSEPHYLL